MNKKSRGNSEELVANAVLGLQERKGIDIRFLDLRHIPHAVADYFVICHGSSNVHAEALSESAEDEIRKHMSEKPWHKEGKDNAQWVLLDYVTVVIHVFQKEAREFYGLEELWADAKVQQVDGEEKVEINY